MGGVAGRGPPQRASFGSVGHLSGGHRTTHATGMALLPASSLAKLRGGVAGRDELSWIGAVGHRTAATRRAHTRQGFRFRAEEIDVRVRVHSGEAEEAHAGGNGPDDLARVAWTTLLSLKHEVSNERTYILTGWLRFVRGRVVAPKGEYKRDEQMNLWSEHELPFRQAICQPRKRGRGASERPEMLT